MPASSPQVRLGRPDDAARIPDVERAAGALFRTVGMDDIADADVTEIAILVDRALTGRLFVAEHGGHLAGFAIFSEVDDVCYLEEVSTSQSGQGIGRRLIARVEDAARARGLDWITLATFREVPWNAPYYARLGFVEWPTADLPSGHQERYRKQAEFGLDMGKRIFMRKSLAPSWRAPAREKAIVRGFWERMQARDWQGARALLAGDAHCTWPVTREIIVGADNIVALNRDYPGAWAIEVLDVLPLSDGRISTVARVTDGPNTFFATSFFTLTANQIAAITEYWSDATPPPFDRTKFAQRY